MPSFANLSLPNRIYGYDFIIIAISAFAILFWLGDSDGSNKKWVSYVSIVFGSFLIGLVQLDVIFTFILTSVIFIRVARSSYKIRALLPLISLC